MITLDDVAQKSDNFILNIAVKFYEKWITKKNLTVILPYFEIDFAFALNNR